MNNYSKGKNEDEAWKKEDLTFENLPPDFIWMHVTGSSKIRNVLEVALEKFQDNPHVVWSASGCAIAKAITCAEIIKRRFPNTTQVNNICYRKCKEYWDPKIKNLDQLVVERDVPAIHIYLYRPEGSDKN